MAPAGETHGDTGRDAAPRPEDAPRAVQVYEQRRVAADDELERARAAARGHAEGAPPDPADKSDKDDGIERARQAARAADPAALEGEKERDAAPSDGGRAARECLSSREARGAITAKRAVTLVQAVRTARKAWDGEVIDYRLCNYDGALAYDLTLLNSEGKVARVRVDAEGKLMGVR